MRRFEGRVAMVSGAAQGMGKAVALRLGAEGATVIAVDINGAGATATAQAIGGASFAARCDIGDETSVAQLFETVAGKFGKLSTFTSGNAPRPGRNPPALGRPHMRAVSRNRRSRLSFVFCRRASGRRAIK